jgi:hypothetical protein
MRAIWDVWLAEPDTLIVFDPGLSRMTYFDPAGTVLAIVNFEQRGSSGISVIPWARFANGTFLLRRNRFIENTEGGTGRSTTMIVRGRADGTVVDTIGTFPETDYYTRPDGGPTTVRLGKRAVMLVHGDSYYRGMGDDFTVDVYDTTGTHLRSLRRSFEPRPVTDDLIDRLLAAELDAAPEDRRPAIQTDYAERPRAATLPAFADTWLVDREQHLWIREYVAPVDTANDWSVFDPDGAWLGTMQLPDSFTPHQIGSDFIIGVQRNELDVETVRRYPLTRTQ